MPSLTALLFYLTSEAKHTNSLLLVLAAYFERSRTALTFNSLFVFHSQ